MDLIKTKEYHSIIKSAKKDKNIIALILFGSYAKGNVKPNSDIDICIIRKEGSMPHDFEILDYQDRKTFDILFYDKLPFYIKFKVFSEGKILALNDEKSFFKIRRKFLHIYRDNYSFFMKNMRRMVANV